MRDIEARLAKIEKALEERARAKEELQQRAKRLQEFVETNGGLIEQMRREICPAYAAMMDRLEQLNQERKESRHE